MKHATPEESIANLDKVREIIVDNAERLEMGLWHADTGWVKRTCAEEAVCGTQHCLAGWLQVCATDDNVRKMDAHLAGVVQAPVAAKMFFRDAPEVLAWLKERKYADEAKDYASFVTRKRSRGRFLGRATDDEQFHERSEGSQYPSGLQRGRAPFRVRLAAQVEAGMGREVRRHSGVEYQPLRLMASVSSRAEGAERSQSLDRR
jgi:hypothetical protein